VARRGAVFQSVAVASQMAAPTVLGCHEHESAAKMGRGALVQLQRRCCLRLRPLTLPIRIPGVGRSSC
jgi:hypothetical protein